MVNATHQHMDITQVPVGTFCTQFKHICMFMCYWQRIQSGLKYACYIFIKQNYLCSPYLSRYDEQNIKYRSAYTQNWSQMSDTSIPFKHLGWVRFFVFKEIHIFIKHGCITLKRWHLYYKSLVFFQINCILLNFLIIKEYWK